MELNEALGLIMKGIESTMSDHGFSAVIPEGTEKGAVPVAVKNGSSILTYTGKKGSVKIEFLEGKISLLCAQSQAAEAVDDDYKKVTMTLFNPDKADSKDIKYLVNDFCDGIIEVYGGKNKGSKKLPQPVSKAEAKPGDLVFFKNTYKTSKTYTHVGIYLGNNQMIHSATSSGISISNISSGYWGSHYACIARPTAMM